MVGRTMECAARGTHLGGIPGKLVFMATGAFAKTGEFAQYHHCSQQDTLIHLVRSRPPHVPLITVSNQMSRLDDPLTWVLKDFPQWIQDLDAGEMHSNNKRSRNLWGAHE